MPDAPLVLAFDTSAAHCAAALLSGDTLLCQSTEPMARGQAERLMVLCQEMLDQAGCRARDLTALGVGIGPGNFTGIRISVSAARGMALGLGIPAVGVSTFEALRDGTPDPCAVTVPAPRDQVYFAAFDGSGGHAPHLCAADNLPAFEGPLLTPAKARLPLVEAIARVAARRYPTVTKAPAPLYLRAPDAAPARDSGAILLP